MHSYLLNNLLRVLLFLGCGIALLVFSAGLYAQENRASRVISMSAWVDQAGNTPLEALASVETWEPFTGWKSYGFGAQPIWIQIYIDGAAPEEEDWVLQIRPAFLDRLTLYDPTTGSQLEVGDFVGTADDLLDSVVFNMRVKALPEPRTLYVRLETTSARTFHIDVLPYQTALKQARRLEWLLGFVLTLSCLFSAWAFLQWWTTREPVMGFFAIKQAVGTVWGFFFLGFARIVMGDWFPQGFLSAVASAVIPALLVTVLLFMATLYVEYKPRRWALNLIYGLAALIVAVGLLQAFGLTRLSLKILNGIIPLGLLLILFTLLTAQAKRDELTIPLTWIAGYIFVYSFTQSLGPLIYLGVITEHPIVYYSNLSHLVMDAFVMALILHIRAKKIAAKQLQTEQSLLMANEQARLNKLYLADQQRLLAMLAHEIKTPLTSLRIWMKAGADGQPAMERTITEMSNLIERCVQTGQINDASLNPVWQTVDGVELTEQVVSRLPFANRIHMQLPEGFAWVKVDTQMVTIVLSNLLDNALKYSPEDSIIQITLKSQNVQGQTGWQWCIENTVGSAGLPDSDKLFDKYYRSPHAQRQRGSGLGLYLVKSLTKLLHGHVLYSTNQNRVRFELWLPTSDEND